MRISCARDSPTMRRHLDDYERARYYPEDDDYLLEREELVTHYEVLADS
jgi:hypothetical protein